jgi:hypothetical protein
MKKFIFIIGSLFVLYLVVHSSNQTIGYTKPNYSYEEVDSIQSETGRSQEVKSIESGPEPEQKPKKIESKINKSTEDQIKKSKINNINQFFKNGVLKGKGEYIVNTCNSYNVDPYIITAIMLHESNSGTSNMIKTKNNPAGIFQNGVFTTFNSLDDGILFTIRLIQKYNQSGRNTIKEIQPRYCPISADNDPNGINKNWLSGVTTWYNKLKR